jgi:NAD(P)-dependent dehydrogenase (short-subunit alcohol dehydrogenase family)
MRLAEGTFLVSGGASGLGAACVRAFTAANASVVIADLNREAGERVAAECGPRARFVATDVTDEESVRRAVEAA